MKRIILGFLGTLFVFLNYSASFASDELVVYSARKEELIKPVFDKFTAETGIKISFLSDEAPKLLARLRSEGNTTPADILITADLTNLIEAKNQGLFKPVTSAILASNIPSRYRDTDNEWFALSKRVRAIFYDKTTVTPEQLSTYEALGDPRWKGQIAIRSSSHPYNQSLLANLIAVHGIEETQAWAKAFTSNFVRSPSGGDSDQLRLVASGQAKLAIANSYYYARMLASPLAEDQNVAKNVGIFFPNQNAKDGELTGAHVNISGAGILKTSHKIDQARQLLEFLSQDKAQSTYALINKEYPINPRVSLDSTLASWGAFKEDNTPLASWAPYAQDAVRISDIAGWR
jgi:iron(III) transport system substrate-binding protein